MNQFNIPPDGINPIGGKTHAHLNGKTSTNGLPGQVGTAARGYMPAHVARPALRVVTCESTGKWTESSKTNPCVICGHDGWCSQSADGAIADCKRGADASKGYWLTKGEHNYHRVGGVDWQTKSSVSKQFSRTSPSKVEVEPAHETIRHAAYASLVELAGLSDKHRSDLLARGFDEAGIQAGRFATLPPGHRDQLADRVRSATGLTQEELFRVPGFYRRAAGEGGYPAIAGIAGLIVPVIGPTTLITGIQIRADATASGMPKYTWMTSRKQGGPGAVVGPSCLSLSHEQWLAAKSSSGGRKVARITEGPIKAQLAQVRTGILTVAVPGVASWEKSLPVLRDQGVEVVRICFDADWSTNPVVAASLARCGRRMVALGIETEIETWPIEQGKGIDDLLLAGGTPTVLRGIDAIRFVRDLPKQHGSNVILDADEVYSWTSWFVSQSAGDDFYADTDLLAGIARVAKTNKSVFGRIETLIRSKPKIFSVKTFKDVLKELSSRQQNSRGKGQDNDQGDYQEIGGHLFHLERKQVDGMTIEVPVKIAQFSARIVEHIERHECGTIRRQFRIRATRETSPIVGENTIVVEAVVDAAAYESMAWVHGELGPEWVIEPGKSSKDLVRHAIQVLSVKDSIASTIVHTSTGWIEHGGRNLYLHGGGCIGSDGPSEAVCVELSKSLAGYRLPNSLVSRDDLARAFEAHFRLFEFAKPDRPNAKGMTAAVVSLSARVILGPIDGALQFSGGTAVGKTTVARILYQHHAIGISRKDAMPAAWNSTPASLQRLAYDCKDNLLVIDELKGDRAVEVATEFLQNQGNLKARDRMDRTMRLAPSLDPRCGVLSTGEADPSSQSTLGRMLVVKFSKATMDLAIKDRCEADGATGLYATVTAGYIRWLATDGRLAEVRAEHARLVDQLTLRFQDECKGKDVHPRHPGLAAELAAGYRPFLAFAVECGAVTEITAKAYVSALDRYLVELVLDQVDAQAESNPAQRFMELLRSGMASGKYHMIDSETGFMPKASPTAFGWRKAYLYQGSEVGQTVDWAIPANSACIGFVNDKSAEILLDPSGAKILAKSVGKAAGRDFENAPKIERDLAEANISLTSYEKATDGSKKRRFTLLRRTAHAGQSRFIVIPLAMLSGETKAEAESEA